MLVTALVTPFVGGGDALDIERLRELVGFQLECGADLVLLAGTTGEGGLLSPDERTRVLDAALEVARPSRLMWALGTGRVADVIASGRVALERGVRDLLLVDAPYSGASSGALRTGWHGAVASALPDARLYPYAVPGRTGTEMLPDDLARLAHDHANVVGVKDATGRLARMLRVRELCGPDFKLLCGDDHLMRDALVDPAIRADGVVSFVANLVPDVVARLVAAGLAGDAVAARREHERLELLTPLVSVTVEESLELGERHLSVPQRSRNPVPVKQALAVLGVIDGAVRAPLAAMGPHGTARVRNMLRMAGRRHSDLFDAAERLLGADLGAVGLAKGTTAGSAAP